MVIGFAMAAALAAGSSPLPTPSVFVSAQYGRTFRTPPSSSYCALPAVWVGSDHGTVIFLTPPKRCSGAGYPSSGRGFDGDVPRIEVFYAYDIGDDDADEKAAPCHEVGRAVFLGKLRRLCRSSSRRKVEVSVTAKYQADIAAQTSLTLVTSSARLKDDLRRFEALLKSARTCTATWHDDKGGPSVTTGSGAPCPAGARWF